MKITRNPAPNAIAAKYEADSGIVLHTSRAFSTKRRAILSVGVMQAKTISRAEAAQFLIGERARLRRLRRAAAYEAQAAELEARNAGHPCPSWSEGIEARKLRERADMIRANIAGA